MELDPLPEAEDILMMDPIPEAIANGDLAPNEEREKPSLENIPPEIFNKIAHLLMFHTAGEENPRMNPFQLLRRNHLVSLCRVSKDLYKLTLPLLYYFVPVYPDNFALLARTLMENPELGLKIERLCFDFTKTLAGTPWAHRKMLPPCLQVMPSSTIRDGRITYEPLLLRKVYLFHYIVERTPGLRILDIRLVPDFFLPGTPPQLPRLRRLRLINKCLQPFILTSDHLRWLQRATGGIPNLEMTGPIHYMLHHLVNPPELSVHHAILRKNSKFELIVLLSNLTKFTCFGSEMSNAGWNRHRRTTLTSALIYSANTLRILRLYYSFSEKRRPRWEPLRSLLDFEVLEHLSIPSLYFAKHVDRLAADPDVQACFDFDSPGWIPFRPYFLMNLPHSLRTLSIYKNTQGANTELLWLAQAFKGRRYPNLEKVTIQLAYPEQDVPGLREAYQDSGLPLTVIHVRGPWDVIVQDD